jgi:hypothetical protein
VVLAVISASIPAVIIDVSAFEAVVETPEV